MAALLVLPLAVDACSGPRVIDRVTLVNPTLYDLDVDVAGPKREGWLGIGHVRRESESVTEQVIDQGDTWIFRFRHAGREAGELQMSEQEMQRSRWRVEIPPSVGEALQQMGAEPSLKSEGG